jgi:lycopene cyclase domain-containing protein
MKWPAWALLALPFAFLMAWLLPLVRRRVRWTACWLTVLVFEAVLIPVEHNSLIRGHWVYNEHRILGPKLWGIPIEEPLIYYLLPPILVIMVFEFTVARLEAARLPDWRAALARLVRRVPETAVGLLRRTG